MLDRRAVVDRGLGQFEKSIVQHFFKAMILAFAVEDRNVLLHARLMEQLGEV